MSCQALGGGFELNSVLKVWRLEGCCYALGCGNTESLKFGKDAGLLSECSHSIESWRILSKRPTNLHIVQSTCNTLGQAPWRLT